MPMMYDSEMSPLCSCMFMCCVCVLVCGGDQEAYDEKEKHEDEDD